MDTKTGFIYKIFCESNNDLYVGSTFDLNKRKIQHKSNCYNETRPHYHLKVYKTIRENGGWDKYKMEIIKTIEVNNITELRVEERKCIESNNCNLNTYIPNRDYKERNVINKNEKKKYDKERYLKQKEHRTKKNKCEICGGFYTNQHKSTHIKTKKHQSFLA